MAAAMALGGFTGPEADTLGYAIRKKKSACSARRRRSSSARRPSGASRRRSIDAVFKAFEPFERYGFNKAHATCYGLIAYQTAYLKANYTVEYMTAVLTAFRDNAEKVAAADRRVPAAGHRGPAAGRPRVAASTSPSRATRSASACWRSRTSARARSSRSSRPARRAGRSGRWPTSAPGSTCASSTARSSSRWPRSARSTRSATRRRSSLGLDDALAAGQAAQRDRLTGQVSLFDIGRGRPTVARAAAARVTPEAPRPRAAALGEGAPRPVPVGPPDGRARGRDRRVTSPPTAATSARSRSTSSAWSSAASSRASRKVITEGPVDDGRRRRSRTCRARSRSSSSRGLRADDGRCGRRARSCSSPAGSTIAVARSVSLLADPSWDWEEAAARGPEAFAARGRVGGAGASAARLEREREWERDRPGVWRGSGRAGRPDGAAHRCARRAGPAGAERLAAARVGGDARRR